MTDTPNPSTEIALDDLDSLLDQEDPNFREDLKTVSEVRPEAELDAETSVELPDQVEDEPEESSDLGRWALAKRRASKWFKFQCGRFYLWLLSVLRALFFFLRTKPIEFLRYVFAQIKAVFKFLGGQIGRFMNLSRAQKGLVLVVLVLSGVVVQLTLKNLKGGWLPSLNPPLVTSLSQKADHAFFIGAGEGEAFYRAFPRDPDIFLLKKFKVNLKPTAEHRNPMGAFEVVIQLDSKEAAIESQDREVELHDLVQREFELMTYPSLLSDLGKQQLKNQIKQVIDDRLSQGWVEEVHFQTFILKP